MLTTSTGMLGHGSAGGLGLLLSQHCNVFQADPFGSGFDVSNKTGIAQLGACIMRTCSTTYCLEAPEPDHGYQVEMEEMGEPGMSVQPYHIHERFLCEPVSHGATNGSSDADASEL